MLSNIFSSDNFFSSFRVIFQAVEDTRTEVISKEVLEALDKRELEMDKK